MATDRAFLRLLNPGNPTISTFFANKFFHFLHLLDNNTYEQTNPPVISVGMPRFQAKYEIEADLDDTERKASINGYHYHRGGGRPEKGSQQAEGARAQLIVEVARIPATIIVNRKKTLVSWEGDYQKINEIESILETFLDPKPNASLKELRTSIPTVLEEQLMNELLTEQIGLEKQHGEKMVQIKELQTLLEIAQERIRRDRKQNIEPLTNSQSSGDVGSIDREQVIKRAKELLSEP
jgi:hypothetical protein